MFNNKHSILCAYMTEVPVRSRTLRPYLSMRLEVMMVVTTLITPTKEVPIMAWSKPARPKIVVE